MREALPNYDPDIERLPKDNCLSKMRGMEHSWASGTANQSRIPAVEVGAQNLILANVDSTLVQELSVPGTFYTGVPVRTILDHLEKDGFSLDRPAGVKLILGLHKLWEADPRVAQFIINMEEAKKKSVRAQLPIIDNILADFATYMLLNTNSFHRNRPVWDGKPVGDQKWAAWKEFFKLLQLDLEHETATAGDAPDMFGTAAAAQRLRSIILGIPSNGHGGDTPGLLELLDGQFDALAAASSTSNAALDHLAVATTKKYAEIKAALVNLPAATAATPDATATTPTSNRTNSTRTVSLPFDQRETEKRILILQATAKNKWKVGSFC